MASIRRLLYRWLCVLKRWWLIKVYGMDIGKNVRISRRAILDFSANPKGIHVGDFSLISGNVIVLAHDYLRNMKADTYIGHHCFIGNGSIIMPGVRIGNHVAVGGGSIVTKDIPDHTMVVGNPARIIRTGIVISDNAQIESNGNRV